ncbi:ATP-binding protein [Massilia sp. W12]|uniref:AAA family ATPase n=1 Tax=Massilia sp. W12 TaxID=3126507 RepID=UPI0030D61490
MLLEFGVKNFFSFLEESVLSLRVDAKCPPEVAQGRPALSALCIQGANASGKTQLLKALTFVSHFVLNSFADGPQEKIGVAPFYGSTDPCEFFLEFEDEDAIWRYELVVDRQQVQRETLYKSRGKRVRLFQREGNTLSACVKELHALSGMRLRSNASIVSTAIQYDFSGLHVLANNLEFVSNVSFLGRRDALFNVRDIAGHLQNEPEVFAFIKQFICDCDTGIADIKIEESIDQHGEQVRFPVFFHRCGDDLYAVPYMMESSGTRSLFCDLGMYHYVLRRGGVLILDEFDQNLHPHILPKLLALFLQAEHNPLGAQLLFTTHDTEIMNLLGRYRIYLVAKEDNESFAYRLDEIPGDILRNDRPIRPVYIEGRIGGVPRL